MLSAFRRRRVASSDGAAVAKPATNSRAAAAAPGRKCRDLFLVFIILGLFLVLVVLVVLKLLALLLFLRMVDEATDIVGGPNQGLEGILIFPQHSRPQRRIKTGLDQ